MGDWLDTLKTLIDSVKSLVKNPTYTRDAWSAKDAIIPSLAFSDVAADKDFPTILIPVGFLPIGATIVEANLILKWRKMIDTSVALNAISAAGKTIRVMDSGGSWGTGDIVAMTMKQGSWIVEASGVEGGDVLISTDDIKAIALPDTELYVRSEETESGEGIVVTAASLTLYDVEVGVRFTYTL